MEAIAHNKAFAKKVGIKQSVGEDFAKADKGKKFGTGGGVGQTQGGKGMINRQETRAGSIFGQKKEVPNINLNKYIGKKEGGMAKSDMKEDMKADMKQDKAIVKKAFKMHDKQEHKSGPGTDLSKLKKGGIAMKKMAKGGETMGPKSMSEDVEKGSNKLRKFGESGVQKRGLTKGKNLGDSGPIKMRTGGKVKRYSGEDGESEVQTETAQGPKQSIGDDVRARAMAAMANRDQDVGGGGSTGSSDATPKPTAKVSTPASKPVVKAEDKPAPAKANPVQQAKDVVAGKGLNFGKSQRTVAAENASKPKAAAPAKKSFKASTDSSDAYKRGGKVGASRGDGIAQRGRTKGKYC